LIEAGAGLTGAHEKHRAVVEARRFNI